MSSNDILNWEEDYYNTTFNEAFNTCKIRRQQDSSFTQEFLRDLIDTLYSNTGNDMFEKGFFFIYLSTTAHTVNIRSNATLDAYERFYREWREENEQ
jgi:hypothetical protein